MTRIGEIEESDEIAGRGGASRRSAARGRLGVAAVAGATFTVVTSEMLPVGLLTPIGDALEVSEGTAGLTLTVTGLVGAVSAPLLTPLSGRFDRRAVLCALMAVLAAGNLLAAWSPDFAVLVAARVLVGIGMGGVWAIAAGLAVRLVPPESIGAATSLIFSGIAVASVLGVPAGTYLGELAGWRTAFVSVGALALVVLAALAVLLPRLPAERDVRLGGVVRLVGEPRVRTGLAVVALLVTGHFAAYTYVRPVLEEASGASAGTIGALLLVYGVAGVAGNFAAGAGAARSPRSTLLVIGAVLAATVALVAVLGGSVPAAGVLLAVWGLSYGGVSVSAQTWLLASAPRAREAASALFVGVFNGAIALGALAGGLAADGAGVTAVMWLGGGLAAAALAVTALGKAPASGRL
ncbi:MULTISPECIES: MFS transporter [unclassified Streptomyces]|uniref:MFS transporter n=1 Tax=unclassified Streptomyces TaxID=2593676 RepID=UPI0022588093|nr:MULTISPECIES: MFS transporter [unclassified Streptomyces]MCX4529580.1 MFS transporter [Streptomyces sp. NBC_01551]MCX4539847.1 MFS transporter [Streptomyces sp. NBC_01565]